MGLKRLSWEDRREWVTETNEESAEKTFKKWHEDRKKPERRNEAKDTQRGQRLGPEVRDWKTERTRAWRRREKRVCWVFEFFTHNVKLLIIALEHRHGVSGPADCDLGSTSVREHIFVCMCACLNELAAFKVFQGAEHLDARCSCCSIFKNVSHEKTMCALTVSDDWVVHNIPEISVSLSVAHTHTQTHRHAYTDLVGHQVKHKVYKHAFSPVIRLERMETERKRSIYREEWQKQATYRLAQTNCIGKHILSHLSVCCMYSFGYQLAGIMWREETLEISFHFTCVW